MSNKIFKNKYKNETDMIKYNIDISIIDMLIIKFKISNL